MPGAATMSLIGTVLFLGSFGCLNLGLTKSTSYLYQAANAIGAALFTYTAISPFNSGLFITEAAWTCFGIFGIWKIWSTQKKRRAEQKESLD